MQHSLPLVIGEKPCKYSLTQLSYCIHNINQNNAQLVLQGDKLITGQAQSVHIFIQ